LWFLTIKDFHESLARLDRYAAGLSDDETIELQNEIAREARDPDNIKESVEQIKEIAKIAISTDNAFATVSSAFNKFVSDYGNEFPKTREFLTQWQGYYRTWTDLLFKSRSFAWITSREYEVYVQVHLKFVQEIETKEDLAVAIARLTEFSENTTTDVPMDYADEFKDLRDKIKFFRDDFDTYLEAEGKRLTEWVTELQGKLKEAEETARACEEIIRRTASYVRFIPIIGWFAKKVTQACMPGMVEKRNKAQADANTYKRQIEEANRAQEGLANMQTQFAALESEFQIICGALAIFANTWAWFHAEALKFADILRTFDDVKDFPTIFKSTVELSRAIAQPLQEGLDAYAHLYDDVKIAIKSTESERQV